MSVERRDVDTFVVAANKEHKRKEFVAEEGMRRRLLLISMGR